MPQTQKVIFTVRLDNDFEIEKSVEITYETTEQLQGMIGNFLAQFGTVGVTKPLDKDDYTHYPAHRVYKIDVSLPRVTLATALPPQAAKGIVL